MLPTEPVAVSFAIKASPAARMGIVGGGVCAQLIRSLLFGVRPLEVSIFAAVTLVVLVIAGTACTYPAWRAARVDPMTALRCV